MVTFVICVLSDFGHRLGGPPGSEPGSDFRRLRHDGELAPKTPETRSGVTLQGKRRLLSVLTCSVFDLYPC